MELYHSGKTQIRGLFNTVRRQAADRISILDFSGREDKEPKDEKDDDFLFEKSPKNKPKDKNKDFQVTLSRIFFNKYKDVHVSVNMMIKQILEQRGKQSHNTSGAPEPTRSSQPVPKRVGRSRAITKITNPVDLATALESGNEVPTGILSIQAMDEVCVNLGMLIIAS